MFDLPEYNALYEKAKLLPDGPERNALYERMVKLILVYVPWMVETYKAQNIVMQPWLLNYKKHPFSPRAVALPRHRPRAPVRAIKR